MTRVCDLTGCGIQYGNNVSHSNRKVKRRFLPNLQNTRFYSETLGVYIKMKVRTRTLKSVEKNGGIDNFLLSRSCACNSLSKYAISVRRSIQKKMRETTVTKHES